jgi:hypothetical protein
MSSEASPQVRNEPAGGSQSAWLLPAGGWRLHPSDVLIPRPANPLFFPCSIEKLWVTFPAGILDC